jgi:hypothetical protein
VVYVFDIFGFECLVTISHAITWALAMLAAHSKSCRSDCKVFEINRCGVW